MYRIIYSSHQNNLVLDDIFTILNDSISRNRGNEISGALIYIDPYFLQCLEGEKSLVQAIYTRIENDPRHEDLDVIFEGEVSARAFDEWNMSLVSRSGYEEVVLPIVQEQIFNPENLDHELALEVLDQVTKVL